MKNQSLGGSIFGLNSALPLSIAPTEPSLKPLMNSTGLLSRAWGWIRSQQAGRTNGRRLQVAATVSLGEKRFVAVIQVDGLQFLIGGGATNVTLLAQLHPKDSFGDILGATMTIPLEQPASQTNMQNFKSASERARERV
jgi:flagellar biogenesis protein FliO